MALLYQKEVESVIAIRLRFAVARKLVAYLFAVDREERVFDESRQQRSRMKPPLAEKENKSLGAQSEG